MPNATASEGEGVLTHACWPIFDLVITAKEQLAAGLLPEAEPMAEAAKAAWLEAGKNCGADAKSTRAWDERIKRVMVYFVDFSFVLGRIWQERHRLELDMDVLDQTHALGGEKFFDDLKHLIEEYDAAKRNDRDDLSILSEELAIFYTCLRLGFQGDYDDPAKLHEFEKQLYVRLADTLDRSDTMFGDAYGHLQTKPIDYHLGGKLTFVLVTFAVVVIGTFVLFRMSWTNAVGEIARAHTTLSALDDQPTGNVGAESQP